jgi:hypothetical protein
MLTLETFSHFAGSGWSVEFPALDSPSTLVLAFGGSNLATSSEALRSLVRAFPLSHVLACSTAGEIHGSRIHDNSIVVAVARFEGTRLASVSAPIDPKSSMGAGETLGRQLAAPDLRGVLVLSDGLGVNGSCLARGLASVLGEAVVVTGGLAGDGDRFEKTWVLVDGAPVQGHATAVGFYGDQVRIGHGSKGGWDVFGPERLVTSAKGNVLYELDGKPALALYKEYLGDLATGLPASALLFPLAIRHTDMAGRESSLVRTILGVDDEKSSMTFAGDIPEGAYAQLMRANFDRLVQGASDAALMTNRGTSDAETVLSIAISCVGRRLVLGQRSEEETEATLDILPRGARQVGFYSYGELSPQFSGSCELHNQTMTLTTFAER